MRSSLFKLATALLITLSLGACNTEDPTGSGESANDDAVLISTHKIEVMDLPI